MVAGSFQYYGKHEIKGLQRVCVFVAKFVAL